MIVNLGPSVFPDVVAGVQPDAHIHSRRVTVACRWGTEPTGTSPLGSGYHEPGCGGAQTITKHTVTLIKKINTFLFHLFWSSIKIMNLRLDGRRFYMESASLNITFQTALLLLLYEVFINLSILFVIIVTALLSFIQMDCSIIKATCFLTWLGECGQ